MKLLHRDADRCEPHGDGPWFLAWDPAHVGLLIELRADEALLGHDAGAEVVTASNGPRRRVSPSLVRRGRTWIVVDGAERKEALLVTEEEGSRTSTPGASRTREGSR